MLTPCKISHIKNTVFYVLNYEIQPQNFKNAAKSDDFLIFYKTVMWKYITY